MTINYCDFTNGDDGTGDGTYGNPYKTITTASTGLTGGDEVRVAKSVDSTDLSGTFTFEDDSNVVYTSSSMVGILNVGDLIGKSIGDDHWWDVTTVASTHLLIFKKYCGTSESVAAKKLGVTDTGEAVAPNTFIQTINSSGISDSSRLKISGGWALSTQVQDGFTYFRQIHSTPSARYGYGIYLNNKDYLEIEKIGMLRYYEGIYLNICSNNFLNSIYTCGNNLSGIYFNQSHNNIINLFLGNADSYNINLYDSNNNIINSPICKSNSEAIYLSGSGNNIINTPVCERNYNVGIRINNSSHDNVINTANCNKNKYGIHYDNDSYRNIINTANCNYNTSNGIYFEETSNWAEINDIICNYNSNYGIFINRCHNIVMENVTCNNNYTGCHFNYANNNVITSLICDENSYVGLNLFSSNKNIINSFTCDGNDITQIGIFSTGNVINTINKYYFTNITINDVEIFENHFHAETPELYIQHFNTIGDNRCYYEFGVTSRDTAEARSTQCLKYAPQSDTFYLIQKFCFGIYTGETKQVNFYIKDNATFNGDVQAALFFMEENITGWTTIPTTIDYQKQSVIAQGAKITEDGVLDLRIKVRGTTGNVFVDDLGVM